jgi:uncharacterized SAM-binding protein YcdF (DUF218 family)
MTRRRQNQIVVAVVLAAIAAGVVERRRLPAAAGRWLDVSIPLDEPVDYVMVLGGGATTRPFIAAAIMRAGLARRALIPRVVDSDEARDGIVPAEHDLIQEALLHSGVDRDAIIVLEGSVDSTESEARCLARFLDEHSGASVAIVTSDFHTRRTRLVFSRACRTSAKSSLHVVGAPTDDYAPSNWWRFENGFQAYVSEYLKLARTYASALR